jgi:hypothetical protein
VVTAPAHIRLAGARAAAPATAIRNFLAAERPLRR